MYRSQGLLQIFSLAWHPAASELAFAARHEEACSFYNSDIYTIRANGSGYRRFTAPTACGQTGGLPTGSVNVYISNWTDSNGPFIVYFQGAPGPKSITLAPGDSTIVNFTNVADYGNFVQWAVVVFGLDRFTAVSGNANVIPGQTVNTSGYLSMWYGYTYLGLDQSQLESDGSQLSYVFGGLAPYTMPSSNTAPGMTGSLLFDIPIANFPYYPDFFSWAPPGPRANQVLYAA